MGWRKRGKEGGENREIDAGAENDGTEEERKEEGKREIDAGTEECNKRK